LQPLNSDSQFNLQNKSNHSVGVWQKFSGSSKFLVGGKVLAGPADRATRRGATPEISPAQRAGKTAGSKPRPERRAFRLPFGEGFRNMMKDLRIAENLSSAK